MKTKFVIQNENQMLRAKIKKNQLRKGSKTKQKK